MIHNDWLSIVHHDLQPLAQNNTPYFIIMVCYTELVIHNH